MIDLADPAQEQSARQKQIKARWFLELALENAPADAIGAADMNRAHDGDGKAVAEVATDMLEHLRQETRHPMKTTPEMLAAVKRLGAEFDVHPAALLAVIETESGGVTSAPVNGRAEPLIRFEGHYFDKRVGAMKRAEARAKGLASPKAGVVKNPASQQARWDRLLTPAMLLDTQAAYESCSWGVGQVMGSHWKALGYASVLALVNEARSGFEGQARLMLRFIETNGLQPALKRRDWPAFARAYNGPGYKANRYDEKMAEAFARYSRIKWDVIADAPAAKPAPSSSEIPNNTLPAPDPDKRPDGLIGGLIAASLASLAAALVAAQCALPDWFINWAGYAAKCTGGQ